MSSRGHDRERAVRRQLQDEDWWTCRAAGSLGDADIVALKHGHTPLLIEVKSTADGPYKTFGPKARADLKFAAEIAGAEALLCWWPPRGKPHWIPSSEWPKGAVLRLLETKTTDEVAHQAWRDDHK